MMSRKRSDVVFAKLVSCQYFSQSPTHFYIFQICNNVKRALNSPKFSTWPSSFLSAFLRRKTLLVLSIAPAIIFHFPLSAQIPKRLAVSRPNTPFSILRYFAQQGLSVFIFSHSASSWPFSLTLQLPPFKERLALYKYFVALLQLLTQPNSTSRDGSVQSRHVGGPFAPGFTFRVRPPIFMNPLFSSIISGSSPTHNTLDGFNMETLRRTTWLTGWTFSNSLVLDLTLRFFFLPAHFPGLTLALMHLCHRELSFTLADDIYIRYLSFTGAEDLEAEMIKR